MVVATFPIDELFEKLGETDRQRIELNRKNREIRLKGDFDKHAARILKMPRFCRADEEVMWLKQYRKDIPLYKCQMLEWQLLAKFNVAKAAAWKNMRKLLLPAPGQYRKKDDSAHSEICAHLFHIICIEVMGNDRVMNRIREFVRCFSDEELSRFIHSAAGYKRDLIPKYFVGFMLLRPDLIQSQKDHIIDQMRGSPHKYRGFERIARLMASLKFFFYTPEQADVLAESFVREIEDMYALKEKDPLSRDLDNIGTCARHRENEQKMFTETFSFFKEYCVKRGFCGDAIDNVGDLVCVIPTDVMHHPIRRVLTYAFLFHRRMVPSIEQRKIMGIWMNDFEWDVDLNGNIEAVRDEAFSYHKCFDSLARFINRFDMKAEGFKRAISQSGGDNMVRLVALALFYESQYEKALEIIDMFLEGRSYGEAPSLHFTRLQVLIRLKKFDEAIGVALHALFHADKNGWTSSTTAPILDRNNILEESEDEDEGLDEYLEDDVEEEIKKSTIHLITERDTALYSCHLLVNLIRSCWRNKEEKGSVYYQALIALSQVNFRLNGRNLFNKLMSEIQSKKDLDAHSLLGSLQNRFIISTFSRIFYQSMDVPIVVCSEMSAKIGTSAEEREKYKASIMEIFQQAHTNVNEEPEALIPSISRFLTSHAAEIYRGIGGNEGKEFVLKLEELKEIKQEKAENVEESKEETKVDKGRDDEVEQKHQKDEEEEEEEKMETEEEEKREGKAEDDTEFDLGREESMEDLNQEETEDNEGANQEEKEVDCVEMREEDEPTVAKTGEDKEVEEIAAEVGEEVEKMDTGENEEGANESEIPESAASPDVAVEGSEASEFH